jgi:hypothetical protein
MQYTAFNPLIIESTPLEADQRAVIAAKDTMVPVVLAYTSVIIDIINECKEDGNTPVNVWSKILSLKISCKIVSNSIMKGKKDIITNRASCAAKAETQSSLIFLANARIILIKDMIIIVISIPPNSSYQEGKNCDYSIICVWLQA